MKKPKDVLGCGADKEISEGRREKSVPPTCLIT